MFIINTGGVSEKICHISRTFFTLNYVVHSYNKNSYSNLNGYGEMARWVLRIEKFFSNYILKRREICSSCNVSTYTLDVINTRMI